MLSEKLEVMKQATSLTLAALNNKFDNEVSAEKISKMVTTLYNDMAQELGLIEKPKEEEAPKAIQTFVKNPTIKNTVFPDYIISLEDGKQYKALRRHLTTRGITPEEYIEKWGLPANYPLVAENYSIKRSELAKDMGLGRKNLEPKEEKKSKRKNK